MRIFRLTSALVALVLSAASISASAEGSVSPIPSQIDFKKPVQVSFKYGGFSEGTAKALQERLLKQGFNVTISEASSASSPNQWRVEAVKTGQMQRAEAAALLSSHPVPQEPSSTFTWSISQTQ